MINVKIHEDDLVDMLMKRLSYWTDDTEKHELFRRYYKSCAYGGLFEGATLDIKNIVDNDYVDDFSVYDDKEIKENNITKGRIACEYNGLYLVYE